MPAIHHEVVTEHAPRPAGPYSQAVLCGSMMFISGQLGINPATKALVEGGVVGEARQAFTNIKNILEAGGGQVKDIVKMHVVLADLAEFEDLNVIYEEFVMAVSVKPARVTFQAMAMPMDARVEIDAIAVIVKDH